MYLPLSSIAKVWAQAQPKAPTKPCALPKNSNSISPPLNIIIFYYKIPLFPAQFLPIPNPISMPASATSSTNRPEALIETLTLTKSKDALAKVLREIKNQIIGNKTKKLLYLKLGAVPKIVAVLDSSLDGGSGGDGGDAAVIVQAAASIGSFACGVEDGVRAVVDAGAVPQLTRILSLPDEKVKF